MSTTPSGTAARRSADLPTVSVVVPAFRRGDRLHACLLALAAQDYPPERFEVVVVDDGSPEPLAPTAAPFANRLRVRVHRQPNAGPAAARNTGAGLATGGLLAFTDDDCEPDGGWLRGLAEAHLAEPRALLGGTIVNALERDLYAEASQQLVSFLYAEYAGGSPWRFFASNNLAAPRADYATLGGFDATFPRPGGEDRDLSERWACSGRPLVAVPAAVVRHAHRMALAGFLRQHATYGGGAYHLHRRRQVQGRGALRIESPAFYVRLVGYPFGRAPLPRAARLAALLAASQVANAGGFLAERWHTGRTRP